MWKPGESLDDYIVPSTPEVKSEPPRAVSLQPTGKFEVLRPLIPPEVSTRRPRNSSSKALLTHDPRPLWFRRFLAIGSVALVMIAFVLMSAILVGINDPAGRPDVATNVMPNSEPTPVGEPFIFDLASPPTLTPTSRTAHVARSSPRRRPIRPSVHVTAIKLPSQPRPSLQFPLPKFAPTTLVIYAENGVINTRIEPWVQDTN